MPGKTSGPVMRARHRARPAPREVSAHLVDPAHLPLFTMRRDWRAVASLSADELPALTGRARALVDMFAATFPPPVSTGPRAPHGATSPLRTALAWLGARAPVHESDIRDLADLVTTHSTSTLRVLAFLAEHQLLTAAPVHESGAPRASVPLTGRNVPRLDEESRRRRQIRQLEQKIAELPEPMAGQIRTWVRVMRGQGRYQHPAADYARIRRYLYILWPILTGWAAAGLDLRQVTADHVRTELAARQGNRARGVHNVLRSLFRALKQERILFANPTTGLSLTTPVPLPAPLPSDRLHGALERLGTPFARLIVALVAIHGMRATEVARLHLTDPDLAHGELAVRRRHGVHTVYLDQLTAELITEWLTERQNRWPTATNTHLLITKQTAHHPNAPRLSQTALRAPFEQIGLRPREVWADRILDEAHQTADPVHLTRLFGLHPCTATRYVRAAHPDKALPSIR
ncbi:hypothetical protein [Streptomyces sp. NPDC056244]|uniref:hypothetical protein n=1 Tax=Streptomyces sp. NPDC056244 TaxID=3345762 RepID=UPI0035DB8C0B